MPTVALDALDSALERATPDAVYLFHGDDDFLKDEKVRELVDRLSNPETRAFNLDLLRGAEVDTAGFSTALDSLPLMAPRRIVVVRDLPALKKDARAVLDRYLDHPAADTVLVLVAPVAWKPEAAILQRASAVEFAPPSDANAVKWTIARAARLGASIDQDAARLLLAATGPDLASIDGELRKLLDFASDAAIGVNAIREIVGVTEGRTATDLIDLVCSRDGVAASALVPVVLSQPKASAVGLVMALTTHMLGIGQVLVDRANRVPPRQQVATLYAMMGEARSAPVARPWGEAVAAMTKHANRWNTQGVDRALLLLREADSALKNTGVSRDEQVVGTLTLAMCAQRKFTVRAA